MHLIELKNVSKYYKSEDNVSVGMKNISAAFNYNEFIAVTGSSGSGKTTLLNVISGLDGYEDGEVYLNGEETSHYTIADWERYRAAYVGFVFQSYNIIDSFTVLQNVMLALDIQNYPRRLRKKRALELIEKVGLLSHKNHKAAKLSGGQKQRAVIARALAKDCPIIVADEPTGNLDSETGKQVLELLHEISQDKLVVVVTHNYSQVEPYATRRIKMHDGTIIEDKKLKLVEDSKIENKIEPKKMSFPAILRFAFKNLLSQPKRFLFILMLQILVVGAITFVYTSQIRSIREAGMENSSLFSFVPETRLLVQRRDGTSMTPSDISYLEKLRDVKAVYEYGENFLTAHNDLTLAKDNRWARINYVDAASTINKRFLKGRVAEAQNEIVVSEGMGFNLGDQVTLRAGRPYEYDETSPPYEKNFIITGITAVNESIVYLSDNYLNNKNNDNDFFIDQSRLQQLYDRSRDSYSYYIENNNNIIHFSSDTKSEDTDLIAIMENNPNIYGIILQSPEPTHTLVDIDIIFEASFWGSNQSQLITETFKFENKLLLNPNFNENFNTSYIFINDQFFTALANDVYDEFSELAKTYIISNTSLSVNGRASGNRVLKNIDNDTYRIFYPANIKNPLRPVYVFLFTILAVITLGIVGAFLYTILHAVTKNVMSARQKDFAIYRSIGANRQDLGKLVIIEQIILSLTALIIVMIAFNILASNIVAIAVVIDYLIFFDYILLFIIFALFGALLGMRFNRKVFKQSVVETLSLAREDVLWLS